MGEDERKWQAVSDPQMVRYLLANKLSGRTMYSKPDGVEFKVYKETEDGVGFTFYCPAGLEPEGDISLYAHLNRHTELDFRMVSKIEPGCVVMSPVRARISEQNRNSPRIAVKNGFVYAANFQLSRPSVEFGDQGVKLGVSAKIILAEFEKRLGKDVPGLRIYPAGDARRSMETAIVERCGGQSILVADTSESSSYSPSGEGLLDYGMQLEHEGLLEETKRRYQDERIASIVTVPLMFPGPHGTRLPYAFIQAESRDAGVRFSSSLVNDLRRTGEEIIGNFDRAGAVSVKERQTVLNFSEGGAALQITDQDIRKNLRMRSRISFDLVFRMQAPLRLNGEVVHMSDAGHAAVAGVSFSGFGHSYGAVSIQDRLRTFVQMGQDQAAT